mmetsp:Transcript_25185/g.63942  ORF Transcript_25185/g.63942 Transcript_25185/m.63942 type:complete len:328 (-) Transcript_25185:660-1643(-)
MPGILWPLLRRLLECLRVFQEAQLRAYVHDQFVVLPSRRLCDPEGVPEHTLTPLRLPHQHEGGALYRCRHRGLVGERAAPEGLADEAAARLRSSSRLLVLAPPQVSLGDHVRETASKPMPEAGPCAAVLADDHGARPVRFGQRAVELQGLRHPAGALQLTRRGGWAQRWQPASGIVAPGSKLVGQATFACREAAEPLPPAALAPPHVLRLGHVAAGGAGLVASAMLASQLPEAALAAAHRAHVVEVGGATRAVALEAPVPEHALTATSWHEQVRLGEVRDGDLLALVDLGDCQQCQFAGLSHAEGGVRPAAVVRPARGREEAPPGVW